MLKGRFLGIAQNIGDAFCFLILTQPDEPTDHPQVLARSVIRKRYPREDPPTVDTNPSTMPLVFYTNDGTTILKDPSTDLNSDDADPFVDVVSDDVAGLQSLLSAPYQNVDLDNDTDSLDDRIIEVYGPPTRRPRLSEEVQCDASSSVQVLDGQSPTLPVPEEQLPDFDDETPSVPDPSLMPMHSIPNNELTVPPTSQVAGPCDFPAAIAMTGPIGDDGRADDSSQNPDTADGIRHVTQEEEPVPAVLEDVVHQLTRVADDSVNDELFDGFAGHTWDNGVLMFRVRWKTEEESLLPFTLVQRDYPSETAAYVLKHKVGSSAGRHTGGRFTRWARQYQRHYSRVVRRLFRQDDGDYVPISSLGADSGIKVAANLPNGTRLIRRVTRDGIKPGGVRKRKKPGRISRPLEVKYGVVVPRSVKHALELDAENGNTFWADAIRKEIDSLLALDCFQFHAPDYKPSADYQWTKLTMIFEVKQDGRRKGRLVAGGHLVDPKGINSRSTVVKGISVRLLDLIAHRDNLPILCGDIGNAFITADCLEKIYSRAGPEFGDREGTVMVFKKAIYGLRSSSRAFRAHFADFLRSLGFSAARYDRDVWMREREEKDGYDYICTHVDDFKIVARDPERWKSHISAAFLLKSVGPPSYYLGNDYNFSVEENAWVLGCATYIKECVRRIETDTELCLNGTIWPHRTPLPESCHPELDQSTLLPEAGIRKYQMLIGMAQWAVTIGRLDIAFAVSSLSRFSAAPRAHHLELALHLFGYLKKHPNRRIVLDSRPLLVDESLRHNSFHPDFLEDYPDAKEDLADDFPVPYGRELETAVFFDADHAHDHVTRRSISGLIVFVGSTPVLWHSKRQGCIATSTYCAEFISMRPAVEEAISIRYMLRCLGIPVTRPTDLFGDNFGVIQSAEIPEGELKKKHIAISYHYVREAIAAKIVNAHWCKSSENFADICTKALGTNIFQDLVTEVMA
jgi:hypothetical protein